MILETKTRCFIAICDWQVVWGRMSSATVDVNEEVQKILNSILVKEWKNYEITHQSATAKGDNFLGDVIKSTVRGITIDGKQATKNFIIKCAHTSEGARKNDLVKNVFTREIYVYSTFHPLIESFQSKRNVLETFSSVAKCKASSNKNMQETLILDDMTDFGFKLHDKFKSMNVYHCKLVMKELGKLHALSFALKDQKPQVYKELSDNMWPNYFADKTSTKLMMTSRYEHVLDSFDPVHERDARAKFVDATKTLFDDFYVARDPMSAGGCEVILHGDCWTNNLLFLYEDLNEEKPLKVCFIDWQFSRIGSPVLDLYYFIYLCTDKEFRDRYFQIVMHEYYTSLKAFLRQLGSDPEKLYPEKIFKKHWKTCSAWGLGCSLILLPLLAAKTEEIPEMEQTTNIRELVARLKPSVRTLQKIKDCFLHLYENNLL